MKKLITIIISFVLLTFVGCSDDAGGTVTDPFGGGNNNTNTGGVTFSISAMQGQQGIIFVATPSVNVKITKVTVSLAAQNFNDVLTDDGTHVYNANEGIQIEEYTGVASGQQWSFRFEGSLASNNQAFNVTSNYTVP